MIIAKLVGVAILGYLLGSIPFGVLISKKHAGVDVREYGSGKMGMANVMRTAGRKAAIAVFLLDFLKGVLAVVFAMLIAGNDYLMIGSISIGSFASQILAALVATFLSVSTNPSKLKPL